MSIQVRIDGGGKNIILTERSILKSEYTITEGTQTRYFRAVDKAGNVSDEKTLTTMTAGTKNFDYTGGIQTFTIPDTGTCKLEVWGAQGGVNGTRLCGGYGGYTVGTIAFSKNTNIYIAVGGMR